MGFDWPFTEENFTCTATHRDTSTPCLTVTCVHGDCVERSHRGHKYGECVCDPGWLDGTQVDSSNPRCDLCCSLPCVNGGECYHIHESGHRICNCKDIRYTGPYCEELKPTTTEKITFVKQPVLNTVTITTMAVVFSFVFLLIVLAVAVLYFSYRRRHKWALKFIQEIYYKFQKPEDDDPRKHDVFLSYRTSNLTDRTFVVRTLLPGLEEMGFTTCIDERDFIPGAFIAESIKVAVQFSRRSLLVISPAYIEGEWPQYEVECAIIESLKKQHRIIPVIFQPINDYKGKLSPTLRQILESITYIEWPEDPDCKKAVDEFWRRIRLCMPKRKDPQAILAHETKESRDIATVKSETLFVTHNGNDNKKTPEIKLERAEGGLLMNVS